MRAVQWVQVGDIDGEAPGEGSSGVAMSSNGAVLAIAGAGSDGGGTGPNAGHVRVYVNTVGGWEQRGNDLDGPAAHISFGRAVALSADGNILAVGAPRADVNGFNSGQVYVYRWNSNDWKAQGSTIEAEAAGDEFGSSVALSDDGTILAVGAVFNNDGLYDRAGHVRVYAWTGTEWNQRGNDLDGASSHGFFGNSVSLSSDGSIVAAGAFEVDFGPGYVLVYRWSNSTWEQQGSTLFGFSYNDFFGRSVSLSRDGRVLAVGADSGNFAVVFRNDGTDWVQIGQTIHGEAPFDLFGLSLSLSSDGNTIVIGGYRNDSNGNYSGHALVLRLSPNGQDWVQVGQELFGEAAGDGFGSSTSIANDGNRIAIGAAGNDGNGPGSGHVRVFDLR